MPHDFIPSRETDLLEWSKNFCFRINISPGSFSLSPAQAAQYAVLHDAFAASFAAARNPNTNSKSAIIAKNTAKKALVANARLLARIIRADPDVSLDQRAQPGLTVPDAHLTLSPVPAEPPELSLRPSLDRLVRLRLRDKSAPRRRGKPHGVAGAAVFSYVGDQPPARIAQWTFNGYKTRTLIQIDFDHELPSGAPVWIAACWYNTRGQNGPMCAPIKTRVPEGIAKFASAA